MLSKTKKVYSYWLGLYKKFPKPERFGIGEKVDLAFLEVLELLHTLRYSQYSAKPTLIQEILPKIDRIKFFSEVSWENNLMTAKQYAELLEQLETIGRELGGWKKSLSNKTSAITAEETK